MPLSLDDVRTVFEHRYTEGDPRREWRKYLPSTVHPRIKLVFSGALQGPFTTDLPSVPGPGPPCLNFVP